MKYWIESSFDFEDKDKEYPEVLVVGCDGGDEVGTKTVATFELSARADLETLVKHLNNPQF
jgi:hypothetical protein